MRARGVACEPEQVFITNGAQQGLTILSRLFLDPGQPAVIEAVTFTGIQQVTAGRGAVVRTVPTDLASGIDVDALEEAFHRAPRPRLAVVIPDFHNPLGVSLTLEKRQRIAELAARYRVPVIEDDPYSALRFEGQPLPPIKAFDEAGVVFYVGSFSKMLAPSLRLGWIVAPAELAAQVTVLRESIDLESSTLIQRAVSLFVERGLMEAHLARLQRCQPLPPRCVVRRAGAASRRAGKLDAAARRPVRLADAARRHRRVGDAGGRHRGRCRLRARRGLCDRRRLPQHPAPELQQRPAGADPGGDRAAGESHRASREKREMKEMRETASGSRLFRRVSLFSLVSCLSLISLSSSKFHDNS